MCRAQTHHLGLPVARPNVGRGSMGRPHLAVGSVGRVGLRRSVGGGSQDLVNRAQLLKGEVGQSTSQRSSPAVRFDGIAGLAAGFGWGRHDGVTCGVAKRVENQSSRLTNWSPAFDLEYGASTVYPCGRRLRLIRTPGLPHSTIWPEAIFAVQREKRTRRYRWASSCAGACRLGSARG
jgi:hypothetical protein